VARIRAALTRARADVLIDEIRLWRDLRTDAEINGFFNKQLTDPATLSVTSDLVVLYKCDDVESAFVHDDASTYHGVLINLTDELAKLSRYTQVCARACVGARRWGV
jgi:hypothetical protein